MVPLTAPNDKTMISTSISAPLSYSADDLAALKILFGCIDNTSLNGNDTKEAIIKLCNSSLQMADPIKGIPTVAAVCVYPVFAKMARRLLQGSGIRVATVAGAFPSGQSPLAVKLAEIQYALDEGAQEIDMVISRGAALEGEWQQVYDEVAAVRELCNCVTLKVILETGELSSPALIAKSATTALEAGADFIKTSTGKIPIGATPEAATTMLQTLCDYAKNAKRTVGFKAAGGISTPDEALLYYHLMQQHSGIDSITNQVFRIGASRLTARLYALLQEKIALN